MPSRSTSQKIIPDRKERDAWWAFISGQPEPEWNPPKKPKALSARQQRQQRYGRGLRSFSEEWTPADSAQDMSYEETVPTSVSDPSGSLPTPSGTPAPTDREVFDSSESTDLSAIIQQREPTPSLLRDIDHVSDPYIELDCTTDSHTEIFFASSNVLHALDQRLP